MAKTQKSEGRRRALQKNRLSAAELAPQLLRALACRVHGSDESRIHARRLQGRKGGESGAALARHTLAQRGGRLARLGGQRAGAAERGNG